MDGNHLLEADIGEKAGLFTQGGIEVMKSRFPTQIYPERGGG